MVAIFWPAGEEVLQTAAQYGIKTSLYTAVLAVST
jgi:hypothetical protein